jgi:hypothetical protein
MTHITVNDLTGPSELAALSGNPELTLDVTSVDDLGRLPAHVEATLYTEATSFSAPIRFGTVAAVFITSGPPMQ